ncbi:TetR/AcrR family transcriptional regulator [Streptomyces sp. NEAU-YJ-81]|uniref:TetR/AcrR family transcriptional regulator n=1 Tax=Streptomyces sp. NEAU-YJ-81 TaxID=2820288 RepID=UPI001ABC1EA6|nr:TetR/AcrR family transcriptional regulator [Streptomyces sp. NEAU-YJ-81]MBO3679194.1 TetR/AcrR family transcriptional regulator [Streptomyces sp. NEAU-YJ-81]
METNRVSAVSEPDEQRADVIVEAAGRLFFAPGFARVSMDDLARELGMSKKTIYRHFPDKRSLVAAVLDRQFAAVERTLVAAAEDEQGQPFGVRVQRFLIAAGTELGRIGAAQLATGRGEVMLRQYVEQRVDAVVYGRLDELFRDGHRRGLLATPPELLSEITRGALERLLTSRLPHELDWTAADLLRATVDTVLYGAIRPAHPGTGDEQPRVVIPTDRDEEEGP